MTITQRRGREGDPMAVQSVAGAQRGAAPFSIRTIALPLAAIVLGTFMAILDNTVVNVALPTLERFFKADLHQIQWVITGYMLAQAAVIPLSGWLGDRFGAKRLYLISISLFVLGCAPWAPSTRSARCSLRWASRRSATASARAPPRAGPARRPWPAWPLAPWPSARSRCVS